MVRWARILVAAAVGAAATGMGHIPPHPEGSEGWAEEGLGQLEALEAPELRTLLTRRQTELDRIRDALAQSQDEVQWFAEAERLGVSRALESTQLPIRQRRRVAAAIVRESRLNDLDPRWVLALIFVESRFNPYAVSSVGARGLMQVMPATGAWLLEARGEKLPQPSHLFDPELNVELGCAYLSALIARFGGVEEALVAYNAGPTTARRLLAQPLSRKRALAGYPRLVSGARERIALPAQPAFFTKRD